MLVTFGGKTTVRLDIAPSGLLVVLRNNFLYQKDSRGDMHAKIGIWYVNRGDVSNTFHCIDPIELSSNASDSLGIEDELVYPVRVPKASYVSCDYICYIWNPNAYISHSTTIHFHLEKDENKNDCWSMSLDGTTIILNDFDPDHDPISDLLAHEVMSS